MLRRARGFTLIELLVAVALGMFVIAAALAFVVQLLRVNSEIVLSTRLHQELRATMALVANDLRRARGIHDPIGAVHQGVAQLPFPSVDVSVAGCARYAHAEGATQRRVIRLAGGKVVLVHRSGAGEATCVADGTALNTDGIEITALTFTNPGGNARRIDITVTGRLRNAPAYLGQDSPAVTRTLRQTIAVRSNGA